MLSLSEAQELHEIVGAIYAYHAGPGDVPAEEAGLSMDTLARARELASMLVSDLDTDRPMCDSQGTCCVACNDPVYAVETGRGHIEGCIEGRRGGGYAVYDLPDAYGGRSNVCDAHAANWFNEEATYAACEQASGPARYIDGNSLTEVEAARQGLIEA